MRNGGGGGQGRTWGKLSTSPLEAQGPMGTYGGPYGSIGTYGGVGFQVLEASAI